eukprot:Nitzschia sp. Nitz4//scaffold174_size87051//69494//71894//NITZ4_005120-RA/size87051-snap-gene-0.116-mRNA-1//-1//CDS//3329538905//6961//frame0
MDPDQSVIPDPSDPTVRIQSGQTTIHSSSSRILDLSVVDFRSTYSALSSTVKALREAGSRHIEFITRDEIDGIIDIFEEHDIDLTNLTGFPYAAADLHDTLFLLSRLQNRLSMQGLHNVTCSVQDIIEDTLIDRSHKTHRYDIGEWVEVRGKSMRYRLEQIEDVVRAMDSEGDGYTFVYETAVDHKLAEHQVRWPREALRRIFGIGPWVWQQWACLKLENKLRFQDGHQDDFEIFDIRAYIVELWEVWLADPRNTGFRNLYDQVGTSGQNELLDHIVAPFEMMHEVVTNENGEWDMDDAGFSMFTYVSLLGSGFIDSAVVISLQVFMPVVLFFYYTSADRDEDEIAVGTREMLLGVLVYYLYKVNRDLWSNFRRVAGLTDNVSSRIQSLRRITWDTGNDSFAQSLGYTIDMFMNTGYVCYLYMFNIWILFNVSDPFELLGSVIIFEFLFDLDEEIAGAPWWDGENRFLKAGIISIIIQNTIRRDSVEHTEAYFDMLGETLTPQEREEAQENLRQAGIPEDFCFLYGTEDEEGGALSTVSERVERLRNLESKASLSGTKVSDESNWWEQFLDPLAWDQTVFEAHQDLRAWSQWEILLFSFPVPKLVPPDFEAGGKIQVPHNMVGQAAIRRFIEAASGKGLRSLFRKHIREVLTCQYFAKSVRVGPWWFRFTRSFHSILAWQSYFIQLCFPVITILAIVAVFTDGYCYLHLGTCEFQKYYYSTSNETSTDDGGL